MPHHPIKIPSGIAALLFAGAALAVPTAAREKAVTTNPAPCLAGEAFTCKMQCGPTTRSVFERFTNTAGVEACVVLTCVCEPQVVPVDIDDPTQPTALVIFGVRQLLPKPPQ